MGDNDIQDQLDEIQEDTTSMEEKIESVNTLEKQTVNTRKLPHSAWKPGESGNPNGRPKKGHSITETIKAMMDERPEIKKALAAKVLQMASEGDITAMKTIWNYIDGMPTQKQEITADIFNVTRGLNDTSQHVRSDEPTPETETNS